MISNRDNKLAFAIFVVLLFFMIACKTKGDRDNVIDSACGELLGNTLVSVFLYSNESITITINDNASLKIKNQSDSIEYFDKYFNLQSSAKFLVINLLSMIDSVKLIDTTFVLINEDKEASYAIQSGLPVFLSFCSDSTPKFYDTHKLNIYNSYRRFLVTRRHYAIDDSLPDFELRWTQYGNHVEMNQWSNYCIERLPFEREIITVSKVIPKKEW